MDTEARKSCVALDGAVGVVGADDSPVQEAFYRVPATADLRTEVVIVRGLADALGDDLAGPDINPLIVSEVEGGGVRSTSSA